MEDDLYVFGVGRQRAYVKYDIGDRTVHIDLDGVKIVLDCVTKDDLRKLAVMFRKAVTEEEKIIGPDAR